MQDNKTSADQPTLHDVSPSELVPETFEPIYNTIVGLRFPVDVAQVLELRYLINHAVDRFPEPAATPDYQEFCDALQTVIDSFGMDNKRHNDRLLRILAMLRDLHYTYSVNTRNAENRLREQMAGNRKARVQSVRYGLFFTFAAIISGIVWLGLIDAEWPVKVLTAAFAVFAWTHLHALPSLDRDMKGLEKKLNELLRHRVKSIHWRTLIHKLALVLGYKRVSGIEVFRMEPDADFPGQSQLRH